MKESNYPIKLFVFLLLFFTVNAIFAKSTPVKNTWSSISSYPDSIDSVYTFQMKKMDPCQLKERWTEGTINNSYDPHHQLLYEVEEEAGRVILHTDAFFDQSLTIIVMDEYCAQMALVDMPKVDKDYLHLDLAAWDCGRYTIMIVDKYGDLGFYYFTLK